MESIPKNIDLVRNDDVESPKKKNNKCNYCDYASYKRANLRTHLKMHSGEKSKNVINVTMHPLRQAI